jgi:hypothetical protein
LCRVRVWGRLLVGVWGRGRVRDASAVMVEMDWRSDCYVTVTLQKAV